MKKYILPLIIAFLSVHLLAQDKNQFTSSFDLAETCVFVKQLLGPFLCDLVLPRFPFSRSYGVILPSSLTMLLPFVLGSSPHLPVSVCGTGTFT